MRQLQLRVHPDRLDRALSLAEEHGAASATAIPVHRLRHGPPSADERILVIVDLPNSEAGKFVVAVRGEVRDATFILVPVGTIPLHTPLEEVDPRVEDVSGLFGRNGAAGARGDPGGAGAGTGPGGRARPRFGYPEFARYGGQLSLAGELPAVMGGACPSEQDPSSQKGLKIARYAEAAASRGMATQSGRASAGIR
jgi:hypothetical protein